MCKPFPPPLVRGGVFLVGLETKYRDIADGNAVMRSLACKLSTWLETKYRDIADGNPSQMRSSRISSSVVGNQVPRYSGWKPLPFCLPLCSLKLETKYRDIADGNTSTGVSSDGKILVGNQVPRYSGWKLASLLSSVSHSIRLETKYRDIADGNLRQEPLPGNPCGWKPSTAI